MNWGYKILSVYVLFIIGIMFLVYNSTQQKFDLVQPDYYAEELKYQNVINAEVKANELGGTLKTIRKEGYLMVILPSGFKNFNVNAAAHLYYAADEKRDIYKQFEVKNGVFQVDLPSNINGAYTLKLNVEMKGNQYYYEQKLFF